MRFDPNRLPLSPDEIEAAKVRARTERMEAARRAREVGLKGDDAQALEVHKAWKPIASER